MTDLPDLPLGFAALPEPLRARIEAELAPGERLLWASQPDPKRPRGPKRSWASVGVWLVGWIVLGLCSLLGLFMLSERFRSGFGFLVVIFYVSASATLLISTHLIATAVKEGPWYSQPALELYAVTERRALIWGPVGRSGAVTVQQFPAGSIRAETLERLEYPDGSGSLTFRPESYQSGQSAFWGVANVRAVDELVRRVLIKHQPPLNTNVNFDPDNSEEPF